MLDKNLTSNQAPAQSYWQTTTEQLTFSQLSGSNNDDVVIIGGGYTGLSCAIHLAKQGIKNISLIEANTIGWGCSGRNAGFVLPGSGRLSYQQLVSRFGQNNATKLHHDYLAAIDLVESLNQETHKGIDRCEQGYLKLAHSSKWLTKLQHSADYLAREFDYDVEFIDKQRLKNDFVDHQNAAGAIRYRNGFGINPLKLVNSYALYAQSLGVKIFDHSAVSHIESTNSGHIIATDSGQIKTDKLVVATNGYTTSGLGSPLSNKILPVLTNVIVTRPLTSNELKDSNFKTHQVMMDTRELKYYYRLLPDNRLLFGGRGAISGKDANHPVYQQRLLNEIKRSFVGLNDIKVDYNWIGWIAVSYDQMPHIYKTDNNIYYASGYCGSGVSFSAFAGKQLADYISQGDIDSPLKTDLPKFPFAPLRRVGQRLFYQYGRVKDILS